MKLPPGRTERWISTGSTQAPKMPAANDNKVPGTTRVHTCRVADRHQPTCDEKRQRRELVHEDSQHSPAVLMAHLLRAHQHDGLNGPDDEAGRADLDAVGTRGLPWHQGECRDDQYGQKRDKRLRRSRGQMWIFQDTGEVDRNRDEHQAGKRGCSPGLSDEEIVPSCHPMSPATRRSSGPPEFGDSTPGKSASGARERFPPDSPSLPAPRLQQLGFIERGDGESLHGADEVFADFK